jgi:hypothetical protein
VSLLNWFWLYSDGWHIAVNSKVKHTVYSVAVLSVSMHDMGVHDVDVHSIGEYSVDILRERAQRGMAALGFTNQCFSSALKVK